jgi:glutamate racemase
MATNGTVQSQSYLIEIEKFFPDTQVVQQACPMLVPLIENNELKMMHRLFYTKVPE